MMTNLKDEPARVSFAVIGADLRALDAAVGRLKQSLLGPGKEWSIVEFEIGPDLDIRDGANEMVATRWRADVVAVFTR